MKKVSISEAKNRLSALIAGVKEGPSVLIVDRGRPVARLEPMTGGREPEQDGRLSRLIRDGIVRPPRAPLPRALFVDPPPRRKKGGSVVAALIEERREGRVPRRSWNLSLGKLRARTFRGEFLGGVAGLRGLRMKSRKRRPSSKARA